MRALAIGEVIASISDGLAVDVKVPPLAAASRRRSPPNRVLAGEAPAPRAQGETEEWVSPIALIDLRGAVGVDPACMANSF